MEQYGFWIVLDEHCCVLTSRRYRTPDLDRDSVGDEKGTMKKKNQKEINVQRNARFFDRWAHSYDAPLFQFWMKGFHQPVLQNIDFSKKVKILDVSCGTGELLLAMYTKDKNKNLRLYGLELSEGMLRRARHKLSKDIVLKTGDVHRLPFPSNYFDLVISTEAFHHYYGQKRALGELERGKKKK